jgi:hypothetical protein
LYASSRSGGRGRSLLEPVAVCCCDKTNLPGTTFRPKPGYSNLTGDRRYTIAEMLADCLSDWIRAVAAVNDVHDHPVSIVELIVVPLQLVNSETMRIEDQHNPLSRDLPSRKSRITRVDFDLLCSAKKKLLGARDAFLRSIAIFQPRRNFICGRQLQIRQILLLRRAERRKSLSPLRHILSPKTRGNSHHFCKR